MYVYVYVYVDVDVYTQYIYNMYTGDIPYKPRAQNHAVQGTQPFQLSKNPIQVNHRTPVWRKKWAKEKP